MVEHVDSNYESGEERITQRIVSGVRVVEKEMHRVIKLVGSRYVDAGANSGPRLVVVDDDDAERASFITKDRGSIAGLTAILQNAMR